MLVINNFDKLSIANAILRRYNSIALKCDVIVKSRKKICPNPIASMLEQTYSQS